VSGQEEQMKVLVVDDSKIIRDRLVNLLSGIKGVETVAQAENAKIAMSTYRTIRPEVLILDIRMRGVNGIELLKQIKNEQHASKVIMLTNFPYPQYKKKCIEVGADYFLDKSSEFDQVGEIIRNLVEQSGHVIHTNYE
jgi:DNA-binding NarL/FixJ family response regulator